MSIAPGPRVALSVPVTAVSLDGQVPLDTVFLPPDWQPVHRGTAACTWRKGSLRLRIYDFGAAVLENRTELEPAMRRLIEEVTGRVCLEPTVETVMLLVDPQSDPMRPRVGWDRVVVRDAEPSTMEAVGHLLGQSAALDRYAQEAERVLCETLDLARELEVRSALPRSGRALDRRVGRIIAARLELARWFLVLDRPESAWSDPRIYELHEALAQNLELKERHAAVLHKLDAVEEAVDTLTDLLHSRRALALEVMIVALIITELVIALA
jgi:uncharacterized Rmd1/YagE family protein